MKQTISKGFYLGKYEVTGTVQAVMTQRFNPTIVYDDIQELKVGPMFCRQKVNGNMPAEQLANGMTTLGFFKSFLGRKAETV